MLLVVVFKETDYYIINSFVTSHLVSFSPTILLYPVALRFKGSLDLFHFFRSTGSHIDIWGGRG